MDVCYAASSNGSVGSATAGSDYAAISNGVLTIPAASTSATSSVAVMAMDSDEGCTNTAGARRPDG